MYSGAAVWLTALVFTANPYLEEGRSFYQALRFREAESRLRLARENPANTAEETAEILDLLARSVSAFGRFDESEGIYEELLAKNPHAPAPSHAAPAIANAFTAAKQRLYSPDYVKLSVGRVLEGSVEVLIVDPWQRTERLVLFDATGQAADLAVRDHRALVERGKLGAESKVEAQSGSDEVIASVDLSLVRAPADVAAAPILAQLPAPAAGLTTAVAPRRYQTWAIATGSGTVATIISTGIFAWRGISEKRELDSSISRSPSNDRVSSLSPDRYRLLETRANRDLTLAVASASASILLGAATVFLWNMQ